MNKYLDRILDAVDIVALLLFLIVTSIFTQSQSSTDGSVIAGVSESIYNISIEEQPTAIAGISSMMYSNFSDSVSTANSNSVIVAEAEPEQEEIEEVIEEPTYELESFEEPTTMYTTSLINVRTEPDVNNQEAVVDKLSYNSEVQLEGQVVDSNWYYYTDNESGETVFVCSDYLSEDNKEQRSYNYEWTGQVLTPQAGRIDGPSGQETYYNLDMSRVVANMQSYGFVDYWVRSDGVKMLDDYIMVAANLNVRPRGSLVETSLGTGLVCDTGDFAYSNPYQIDIATTW